MIDKQSAIEQAHHGKELHYGGCKRTVGPRGGVKYSIERYRVASRVKIWVTMPDRFEFTVRHGMGPHTYAVDNSNCDKFHWADDCPAIVWNEDTNERVEGVQ